jgi:hypothetical protein
MPETITNRRISLLAFGGVFILSLVSVMVHPLVDV